MKPPNIAERWEDNDWWQQEMILAYCSGRDYEDAQLASAGIKL